MNYQALEMIEEGYFDDNIAVAAHLKLILWKEIMTEGEVKNKRKQFQSFHKPKVFQTDEEVVQELNKSTFLLFIFFCWSMQVLL